MQPAARSIRWWVIAWVLATLAGAAVLARGEWLRQRDLFDTDARIMHRLLSQRVVQHDAILATLALLQPLREGQAVGPEQRLPALYPQILSVQRLEPGGQWPTPGLQAAEQVSRAQKRAALGALDPAAGRYQLVLAARPDSYAIDIDIRAMVPWDEWPKAPASSPVRVALALDNQLFVLQPGTGNNAAGWRLDFHKQLAAASQPFDVQVSRSLGWQALPWFWMAGWAMACALALAALHHLQRQRAGRRRAEELLRLGQVARLNTLGELAAGMAHELNQPLTAVLANTQAAARLLDDDPPDPETARRAMKQAAAQARRASDVINRLRRMVEQPVAGGQAQVLNLADAVSRAIYLLEPECRRHGVTPLLQSDPPVLVLADPVALDQIVHNLLMNALQALDQVALEDRRLTLTVRSTTGQGVLEVADTGPGIAPEVLLRLFEPFFSTRDGGLGLGLSLSETLAGQMGGSLSAANQSPRGAVLRLTLPLAKAP